MESYSEILNRAVNLIKSEGFAGAHSFVFLTRYAALNDDKALMRLVGNSLEVLEDMPVSPMLAYAYGEYYMAEGSEFCPPAADYILNCCEESPMLVMSLAKCASAFVREDYLERAMNMAAECALGITGSNLSELAFSGLAYLELWRVTQNADYLNAAEKSAEYIRKNFRQLFKPEEAYDLEMPSGNSAAAVLYSSLACITQKDEWTEAESDQNRFVSMLADKYPTACSFGLCALLPAEYGSNTVLCELPGEEYPKELLSLLSFYAPTTEIIVTCFSNVEIPKYYLLKNGEKQEISL